MKKRELRNGSKIVSAFCAAAVIITILCQFVPYWTYTGIAENKEISEERAMEMKSSIAGYCWIPNSTESDALEEYIQDPSLYYVEEVETVEYDEEELAAVKGAVEALDEEPVEDEAAEEKDDTTAETEENVEEVVEEPADEGEVVVTKGMLVTIKQYSKPATEITEAAKLSKETYGSLKEAELVNQLTTMPVLALVISVLALLAILWQFKKAYIPAIAAVIAGAYNLAIYGTQLIFKLSDKWGLFMIISGIVIAVGVIAFVYDFYTEMKAKKAAGTLQESVEA